MRSLSLAIRAWLDGLLHRRDRVEMPRGMEIEGPSSGGIGRARFVPTSPGSAEHASLLRDLEAVAETRTARMLHAVHPLLPSVAMAGLHRMRLEPMRQVGALAGTRDRFHATGDDPQLRVVPARGRFPSGLALVGFRFQGDLPCDPELRADVGEGPPDALSIRLAGVRDGWSETLVRLPAGLRALELRPLAGPGEFRLEGLRIQEVRFLPRRRIQMARLMAAPLRASYNREIAASVARGGTYADWVRRFDTLAAADLDTVRALVTRMPRRPLVSVLLRVGRPDEAHLRTALLSVLGQVYPDLEVLVELEAADGPDEPARALVSAMARRDRRIHLLTDPARGPGGAVTSRALQAARGEYVTTLGARDALHPLALYHVAAELARAPAAEVVYTDEDRIPDGWRPGDEGRFAPFFKPGSDPDRVLAEDLMCRLAVLRTESVRRAGGLRPGPRRAAAWDLVLRVTDGVEPARIRHVPRVLYHQRSPPEQRSNAALSKPDIERCAEAVQEALDRRRTGARAAPDDASPGVCRVTYPLARCPRVAVIVPARDRPRLLAPCIDSLLRLTRYPNLEVLVVDAGSADPAALALLGRVAERPRVRVIRHAAASGRAASVNHAAAGTSAELLAVLRDDVEVADGSWLNEMVPLVLRDGVGAVGARLISPQGASEPWGVASAGDAADAARERRPQPEGDPLRSAVLHGVAALGSGCLVVRRGVFREVGGLAAAEVPRGLEEVDLCLRIREKGHRILWTPYAVLRHAGADEPDATPSGAERESWRAKWAERLAEDPSSNPNLEPWTGVPRLAFPPRVARW